MKSKFLFCCCFFSQPFSLLALWWGNPMHHYGSFIHFPPPSGASNNTIFWRLRCLGRGAGKVNIMWSCQQPSPFRPLSLLALPATTTNCNRRYLTLPRVGPGRLSVLARRCNWPVNQPQSIYGAPTEYREVCVLQGLHLYSSQGFCCLVGCFCFCSLLFGKWDRFSGR